MSFRAGVAVLFLSGLPYLSAQARAFQQQEQLHAERRVETLEENLAARSEDVQNLSADIAALKAELKTVREQAKSAADLSKSNQDRIDQIAGIGRLILGAVAFLIGAIVTQWLPRLVPARASAARNARESPHTRRTGAA